MPAAIGAGHQPEQDSRCTGRLVTVGTQKHCRPRSPSESWRHSGLPAVTRIRSSPTNRPLQRPLPRLFLLKGPAEGPAHAWCDHKGEVTQCMQPTAPVSGGPLKLAQQQLILWYDRPRIRMTWRTWHGVRSALGPWLMSLRLRWVSSAIGLARIFLKVIAFIIAA
jgi:hypothetical protein